ncbi:unnamed protein product [Urochloa decumbens]|uniref:Protein kinase domain-containing protein n=1 Tax=Urochloa decumbens TaxID=240449 RepID=A0ABC9B5C1_9POAL
MEPEDDVPFHILREITDDFSEERKLGEGSFGVVYKGVTKNGAEVAVKMLRNANLDHKQFQNEFYNLRKLKHQNIVEVLGYCYETEQKPFIIPDGNKVFVDETYRALCLEYLHNGSLQGHLSDEFSGLDWHTRFRIIKGTCEGLKYIHEDLEEPIYHLDLKPDNILLDKHMVPKIADFGLSRICGKELTRTTQNPYGTFGYQPPEYIDKGEISGKFDIFSFGVVMIRIVSGHKGYPSCMDTPLDEFKDHVRRNWRNRLQPTCSSDSSLEAYCKQVEACTQIALDCVQKDSHKRPNLVKITEKLNEIENNIGKLPQKGFCKIVSGMTMYNKKIEKRKESKDIIAQHRSINLMTGSNRSELEFFDAPETTPDVVEELIVGRTEEKGKIMASLLEGLSKKIIILPIYGIGGIGKTTLARLIYDDPNFTCYSHVWIDVSHRFELNKIIESIVLQLSGNEIQANESQMIHSSLAMLLSSKKILVVLDDLWEDNQFRLQELKDMLYHDNSNIIIIATTRSERVAERICTNFQPYKISPLTNDMCWDIIKQRSGFERRDDKEQLAGIGLEIARTCCGVPLAARSLGFTLRSMNFDQWMKVKDNDLRNEPVLNNVSLSNHVLTCLKLSYSYMPLCLKPCFTYCAIFPKGHKIVKNDLIYQWISSGFINPTKLLSNIEVCERFIVQLLGLSFFQRLVSPKIIGVYHEDDTVFSMHDLVHDLARLVMVDEILDVSKQGITGGRRICFKLLDDCTEWLKAFTQYPTKIRALSYLETDNTVCHGASSSSAKLLCFRVSGKIGLRDDVFSAAKYLRVLDLTECSIRKLPDSIGNLKQLRYLNAPRVQHRAIPSCVTKLSRLIYLSLRESSAILALPESIGEMEGLMYLDLSGCSRIKKLPVSFAKLKKLVHLDLSSCSNVTDVSKTLENLTNLEYLNLSHCSNIASIPEYLSNLLKVRNYNLSYKEYIERFPNSEVLVTLRKLESFNLEPDWSSMLSALSRLTNLMYLNLSGVHRDSSRSEGPLAFGILKNLVYLDLSRCDGVHGVLDTLCSLTKLQYLNLSQCSCFAIGSKLHLPRMSEAMGNLTELRYLNLSNCSDYGDDEAFLRFLECINNLPNLQHLDLSYNIRILSVPDSFYSLGKLHTLDLSGCRALQILPENLNEMASLKFLYVTGCVMLHNSEYPRLNKLWLSLPYFQVQADSHDSSSNLVLLQDVNHYNLVISKLENVKSVQEARSIKLTEKQIMKELEVNWTEDAGRFVEDMDVLGGLVPPITLEYLTINGYNSVRFPEWFVDIAFHLPNLVRVSMSNLPMCNSLPPLGQLPNLRTLYLTRMNGISKIDWEFCGGSRPFPKLEYFALHEMESLKVWYTTNPCDEDRVSKFMFPNLRDLSIEDCPNLRIKPCPCRAAEVWNIYLSGFKVPMYHWRLLHDVTDLTKLSILNCSDLSSSSEITRALSSLQSLTLDHNHQPELPNWLGQLESLKNLTIRSSELKALQWLGDLTSLQRLEIRCPNLNYLPESIGRLASLNELYIRDCNGITSLPESIGALTSLKELNISYCECITSLPESIQQLTKLERLITYFCKELAKWYEAEENKMKLTHIKEKEIY